MAASPRLRAVKVGEGAAKPKTVAEAAAHGTRLELLVATRDRLARTVDSPDCPPRDLAALTRRLMDIAKEIEAIDLAEKAEEQRRANADDEEFDPSSI